MSYDEPKYSVVEIQEAYLYKPATHFLSYIWILEPTSWLLQVAVLENFFMQSYHFYELPFVC